MKKMAGLVFLVAITLLSAHHFYKTSMLVREAGFIDAPMFILQSDFFLQSGELYRNPLKTSGDLEGFEPAAPWFKFPPAYMLPFMPWASPAITSQEEYDRKIHDQTRAIWAVHVVRYLISLAVLIFLLRPEKSIAFIFHAIATGLLFTPYFESLYGLIFDNLLLFFIAGILLLYRFEKNRFSGWIIGAAAALKIYPAILLLWSLAARDKQVIVYAIPALALLLLAGLQMFGVDNSIFYYTKLLPVLLQEKSLASPNNFSIGYFFVASPIDINQAMLVFFVFKNLLLVLTIVVLWMCKTQDKQAAAIKLSLIVCAMLLYLPNYWGNYQLVLLLPILSLLANAYASDRGWRWQGIIAIGCWFFMLFSTDSGGVYVPFSLWKYLPYIEPLSQYRPLCPLILWLATAFWLLQKSRGQKS